MRIFLSFLFSVVSVCVIFFVAVMHADWTIVAREVAPVSYHTEVSINEALSRIHLFVKNHKELPNSLDELPSGDSVLKNLTDGWGKKLIYSVDNENDLITLSSYGKDGKSGGVDDNADLVVRYHFSMEDGSYRLAE